MRSLRRRAGRLFLLLAAAAGCARGTPAELPPAAPTPELAALPSASVVVVRWDLSRTAGSGELPAALAESGLLRLPCLAALIPSLRRVSLAVAPGRREPARVALLEGDLEREAVAACAGELVAAFGSRLPVPGTVPGLRDAGAEPGPGGVPHRWLVALDADAEKLPLGIRGPLATAFARHAASPLVLAALGGQNLARLADRLPVYLPRSSMDRAYDRILWLAYGLEPGPDGGAAVRFTLEMDEAKAASALAREVGLFGRITGLDGEHTGWAEVRGAVRELSARPTGDGRRVEGSLALTPAGVAGLLR